MTDDKVYFDKPVIILPHYGDFGSFLIWHIRWADAIQAPQKTVCCQSGEEIFYPSATDFFYDWENPLGDSDRKGWRDWDNEDKARLIELFSRSPEYKNYKEGFNIVDLFPVNEPGKYSHAILTRFGTDGSKDKTSFFAHPHSNSLRIKPKKLVGLKCDVVLGPRKRIRSRFRNWPHWHKIGEMLKADGLSFAVVGKEETTFKVKHADIYSWEYESPDSIIELLQSTKVFASMDTGTAHLAALVNSTPMVVLRAPKTTDSASVTIPGAMRLVNAGKEVVYVDSPDDYLEDPKHFYKKIIQFL